jgi:hypothetical protein
MKFTAVSVFKDDSHPIYIYYIYVHSSLSILRPDWHGHNGDYFSHDIVRNRPSQLPLHMRPHAVCFGVSPFLRCPKVAFLDATGPWRGPRVTFYDGPTSCLIFFPGVTVRRYREKDDEMNRVLMQLVAYGSHDIFLTGHPQITYFRMKHQGP